MNFARLLSAAPMFCFLAACGAASAPNNTAQDSAPIAQNAAVVNAAAGPTSPNAFKIGANLNSIQVWDNTRPFMNLIMGSAWQMLNTAAPSGTVDIPQDWLDANGWVKNLPAGYRVYRGLSVPAAGGNIVCRFQGSGTLNVSGGPATNVSTGAGTTSFTVPATNPKDWNAVTLSYENIDPSNYIRNIDCRESGASATATIAPEFISAAQGLKVLRFVKWTPDVEANAASITWDKRNKPGDGEWTRNDGVPVEVMVETANQLNADPWFTIPWNASDDYVTRFATYVRDNLASGHQAYFEVSNEVWNGGYPVFNQARSEAQAEGLKSAEDGISPGGPGERYSEKTKQVMSLVTNVYAGQMDRVVRVFAFQHVQPAWSDLLLKYMNTYQSVDALATAPYFGYDITSAGQTVDTIMAQLPSLVDGALIFGNQQKAIAQKYNLRYVTYEGGQHIILRDNLPLLTQVERDPRMYDAYKRFLTGWQSQIGDTMTLFAFTGPISQFGAWGLSEYANQPVSETPKMRAVKEFLGLSTTTADGSTSSTSTPPPTTTTYTCPDGMVVLSLSSCPTTTKKKGATGKGSGGSGGGTGGGGKSGTAIV